MEVNPSKTHLIFGLPLAPRQADIKLKLYPWFQIYRDPMEDEGI